jgi:hypothetical protein
LSFILLSAYNLRLFSLVCYYVGFLPDRCHFSFLFVVRLGMIAGISVRARESLNWECGCSVGVKFDPDPAAGCPCSGVILLRQG